MATVFFQDDGLRVQVEEGICLTDVCDAHPTSLLFGCRDGACGTCLVEVVEGSTNLSAVTDIERDMLDVMAEGNPYARLACQCLVKGDVQLRALR
jgi:2Fe-2S ferredoxin